jgi:chitodextrinase
VPGNLTAQAGDRSVALAWSASSDNVGVAGYRVLRNGTQIAAVGGSTTSYTDTGLTNGTSYSYTVKATDVAGNVSLDSNTASATPVAATGTAQQPPVPGSWTLKFDDEFDGTALDTTKWTNTWFNGATQNNVATVASNVSVGGGVASLQLSDATHGALIHTTQAAGRYSLPVGGVVEARILFPGSATQDVYNWPAFWANGTDAWPAGGEHDIAEGLGGDLTINYHGTTNTQNFGTPAGGPWGSAYHTFTLYRKAGSADVYWDGVLKKSYPTGDSGVPEDIILNAGASGSRSAVTGSAGAIKVDYVRAWAAG